MGSLSQQQIEAAQEFVNTTIDTLRTEKGVYAETAIAGAARMAGTFMFHSFEFNLDGVKAGQAVYSDMANVQGLMLVQRPGSVLSHMGITLDKELLSKPPGTEIQPLLGVLETQWMLEPEHLMTKNPFGSVPPGGR